MTVPLIYRLDNAPRGVVGKGSNLSPSDIDGNFYNLAVAVNTIQASLRTTVSIDHFIVAGAQFWVVLTDHSERGPFTLPTVLWNFRGVWAPLTTYTTNDVFTTGPSAYVVLLPHTSASTFDAGASDGMGHDYYDLLLTLPAGLPTGGSIGSVLIKASAIDYQAAWGALRLESLSDIIIASSPGPTAGDAIVFDGVDWISGKLSLTDLSNVSFSSSPGPVTGEALIFNGVTWVPGLPTGSGTLAGLNDVSFSSPELSDGDVLTFNSDTDDFTNTRRTLFVNGGPSTTVTSATSVTIFPSVNNVFKLSPSTNVQFTADTSIERPTSMPDITIQVATISTTSFNITFGPGFGATGGALATGTASGRVFVLRFAYIDLTYVEVSRAGPF